MFWLQIKIKGEYQIMDDNKPVIIQNLIDANGLDESFYLALLHCVMEHREKELSSKKV